MPLYYTGKGCEKYFPLRRNKVAFIMYGKCPGIIDQWHNCNYDRATKM